MDKWCQLAFDDLKMCLCTQPILQIFDSKKKIYICTDASKYGIVAILKQEDENGYLHPVSYFSKKLLPIGNNIYT